MSDIIFNLFEDQQLNQLATDLIIIENDYFKAINKAENALYEAFHNRWKYGKLIHDNYDHIIEVCGTQKDFAEAIGKTEGVVSNNRRGYESLVKEGATTWEDVIELLKTKNIKPTIRNFEKIGALLNAPTEHSVPVEQKSKDRKRLEQLLSEAEEILRRTEPANKPALYEDASATKENIEAIIDRVDAFDPEKTGWKSEKYLNFVRKFGYDLITMEPIEYADPHHTTALGASGNMGDKLPDYYCIPVSRNTHNKLESGEIDPSPETILQAQFITLTAYIMHYLK